MTLSADTIQTDVSFTPSSEEADGFDAFLSNLTGEEPKKRSSTETTEKATDQQDPETPADTENTTEGAPEAEPEAPHEPDPDDAEVEVKVGEETKKATLRELKRLYGQEAALTQRSQKVAAQAQEAAAVTQRAQTALQAMLKRAEERHAPYRDLDMLVLSQRMDTESFEQLRRDAAAAEADVKFFRDELAGQMQAEQQRTARAYQEAAQACIKALEGPEDRGGIKGFGQAMWNELATFADTHGLPEFRRLTSPAAIRVVHMAMQFEKAQEAAKSAQERAKPAPQRPTRVLKPGAQKSDVSDKSRDAMKRLRASGDIDSAADAFLVNLTS